MTHPQNKWYFLKKDPIEVLEADPDLIRRAEVCVCAGGALRRRRRLLHRGALSVHCIAVALPLHYKCISAASASWTIGAGRFHTRSTTPTHPQPLNGTRMRPYRTLNAPPTEACDVPLEPVYIDSETGNFLAPSLNYKEKRADWQAYIDKNVYKQKD